MEVLDFLCALYIQNNIFYVLTVVSNNLSLNTLNFVFDEHFGSWTKEVPMFVNIYSNI